MKFLPILDKSSFPAEHYIFNEYILYFTYLISEFLLDSLVRLMIKLIYKEDQKLKQF